MRSKSIRSFDRGAVRRRRLDRIGVDIPDIFGWSGAEGKSCVLGRPGPRRQPPVRRRVSWTGARGAWANTGGSRKRPSTLAGYLRAVYATLNLSSAFAPST